MSRLRISALLLLCPLLLLLPVLCPLPRLNAVPPPGPPPGPRNVLDLPYNPSTETYTDLTNRLRPLMLAYTPTPIVILGSTFLQIQRKRFQSPPPTFVMLNLVCGPPGQKATIAICSDDFYMLHFKNRTDHWHTLRGIDPIVPESTMLSFAESYPELLPPFANGNPRSHRNIDMVPLGRASAVLGCQILSEYNPQSTTDDVLKSAFVGYVVTVSEGQRFAALNRRLQTSWGRSTTYMSKSETPCAVLWGKASKALRKWNNGEGWSGTSVAELRPCSIYSPADASAAFTYLLRHRRVV